MKAASKRTRNVGLRHSEITPWKDVYVLTYCYHGSSFIHSKDFSTLEEAQHEQEKLRNP